VSCILFLLSQPVASLVLVSIYSALADLLHPWDVCTHRVVINFFIPGHKLWKLFLVLFGLLHY